MAIDERLREVETQLATLNGSLPGFQKMLENAINKVDKHESNASSRWDEHLKCMVAREKATDSIRVIWVVVGSILLINTGMVVTLITRVFAR